MCWRALIRRWGEDSSSKRISDSLRAINIKHLLTPKLLKWFKWEFKKSAVIKINCSQTVEIAKTQLVPGVKRILFSSTGVRLRSLLEGKGMIYRVIK